MVVTHRRLLVVITLLLLAAAGGVNAQTCTPPTVVQIGGSNPSCAGQPVTLDAGGGWATYAWSNGATTRVMTDTPGATTSYTVTVTDGGSCSVMSQPLTVTLTNNPPAPAITLRETTLCPGADGEASTSTVPSEGLQWSIIGGRFALGTITSGATVHYTADGPGPIELTLTATLDGCSTTTQATVQVTANPEAPVIVPETSAICAGTQSTATVQGTWQYVMWSITNGAFITYDPYSGYRESPYASGTTVTYRADGNGPVTLSAQVYNDSTCISPVGTAQVGLRTVAAPVIVTEVANVCPGRQTTASVQDPAEGTWEIVTWSITNGVFVRYDPYTGYQESQYGSGPVVTYRATGDGPVTLSAQGWDSFGCMSPTGTAQVGLRTVAAPVIVTEVANVCPGRQTTASVQDPAEGTWDMVTWSITNGLFVRYDPYTGYQESQYSSGLVVTYRATGEGPVTLTAQGWDNFGCMSPSGTAQVALRTVSAPVITAVASVCPGRESTASVQDPADGSWESMGWSITNGVFVGGPYGEEPYASGLVVRYRANGNGPVTLVARGWDSFGCTSPEATVQVAMRTVAAPVITTAVASVCPGSESTASVSDPAEGTWQHVGWSITNGVFVGGPYGEEPYASGLVVRYRANGNGPVTLTARGWDNFGCTSPEATAQVAIRTVAAPVITTEANVCAGGESTASVSDPAEGTWQQVGWSITNGVFVGGPYGEEPNASGLVVRYRANGNGPVTLIARGWDNFGCTSPEATAQVALRTVEPPVIAPGAPTVCPNGESWAVVETPAEWQLVSWTITNGHFRNGPGVSSPTSTGSWVIFVAHGSGPVTLTARGTDASGCTSADRTLEIPLGTVEATITASGSTQLCPGSPVTLTASEGATWAWTLNGAPLPSGETTRSIVVTNAGTYSVTVTGENGCSGTSAPVTVTAAPPATPVEIYSPAATLCPGGSGSADAGDPRTASYASYFWSITNGTINGSNTEHAINFTTGASGETVLTLVATDANGCSVTDTATVQVGPPSAAFTLPATVCAPGGYNIRIPDGVSSYAFEVDGPGSIEGNVLYLNAGTGPVSVTLTVTGEGGCTASSTVVTQNNSVPALAVNAPPVACARNGNSASIDAGYSYQWSITNGALTSDSTQSSVTWNASPTATQVTVGVMVSGSGCQKYFEKTIAIDTATAAITAGGPTTFCAGGSVTLTANDGASWSWTLNGSALPSGATTQSITVSAAGTYEVTVTTANGCSATASKTVVVDTPTASITPGGPTTFCQYNSVTLTASEGAAWSWTNGATTRSITVGNSGDYGVTVTNANGCTATATPVTVTANPLPQYPSISWTQHPATLCDGDTETLTAYPAGMTYLWANGETTQSITVTTSGNYGVIITTPEGCSTTLDFILQFRSNPFPTITTDSGTTTFCDSMVLTADSTDEANVNRYVWQRINGFGSGVGKTFTVFEPGTYEVRAEYYNGCSRSTRIDVTKLPAPDVGIGPAAGGTVCPGSTTTIEALGGNAQTQFLWTTGETTRSIVVSTPGTYGFTATDPATGCSIERSTVIGALIPPPAPVTASGPTTFCEGGSVTLTGPDATTYNWMLNGSALPGGATTRSINVTQGGSYTLDVVYSSGCSATSNPITVTVNPRPVPDINVSYVYDSPGSGQIVAQNGDAYQICGNPTLRLISTVLDPAFTYSWSTGANTAFIDATASGTYTLTVTNAQGCSNTTSVTLSFNPYPPKPVVSASSTELCPAGGSITLTAPAADTYEWMLNGSALPSGATTRSILVTDIGSYSVRVTSSLCQSPWSDPVTITRGQSTVAVSGTTDLCENGSVTLTANAGDSYLWSNGANTRSIVVTDAGSYSVAVTINGCTMETSAPVTVTRRSVSITAAGPTTFCNGGSVRLSASPASSYTWMLNGSALSGATTQSIDAWQSGSYTVTAVFADGCSMVSAPVAVEARQLTATVAADATTICAGGSITMQSTNVSGGSGYTYQWVQGGTYTPIDGATSTTMTLTPATSGFVYLKVTDALGCQTNSNSIVYQVLPPPEATITAPAAVCAGGSGDASVPEGPAGTTYSWSAVNASIMGSGNAVSFTHTGGGDVALTVTVTNAGCSRTTSRTVTANALPVTPTIAESGPTTFCTGGTVRLTAPAGFTYEWSNGSTNQWIDVTTTSTHRVTVINANGCRATSGDTVVTVSSYPAQPTIDVSGPTTFCAGGTVRLTAPAGFTYLWSTGDTTRWIDVTAGGAYHVTVTNAGGCSTRSADTVVTVNPATVITTQPYSGPVARNTSRRLEVVATGTAPLSYQWQRRTTVNGAWSIVGTNSSIYDTPRLGKGTYWFRVIVTGGCGATTSNISTLTVN